MAVRYYIYLHVKLYADNLLCVVKGCKSSCVKNSIVSRIGIEQYTVVGFYKSTFKIVNYSQLFTNVKRVNVSKFVSKKSKMSSGLIFKSVDMKGGSYG